MLRVTAAAPAACAPLPSRRPSLRASAARRHAGAGARVPPCCAAADASASADLRTCRQCRKPFRPADNGPDACIWHPDLFTGGELGKYTGFVPASPAYEDRMKTRGMVRFWDCCGATDAAAPGCCRGKHASYDDDSRT